MSLQSTSVLNAARSMTMRTRQNACCPRDIDEVYICGKCETEYDYFTLSARKEAEQKAEQCCTDEEGNEIIFRADLEEAGQLRLVDY